MIPNRPTSPRRTLGPIADLERHLPPEWWKKLFNAVYLKTDGDVVENTVATQREVDRLIEISAIREHDNVLDLCCGQGRHVLELARRGFDNVTGLDRSKYLIRLARRRARKEGVRAAFHEGDARKLRFRAATFDCVGILGNSFGFFEHEADDEAVLHAVRRVLKSEGKLVMDITDGDWMRDNIEPRSWEWIDDEHLVCRERSLAADGRRVVSREVVVNAEMGVIADQFYAERLYTQHDIVDLLDRVGFKDVVVDTIATESDRNQDLGMLGRRNLIYARAPVTAAPAVVDPTRKNVTVLLGDKTLPDLVKKDGRFNHEDIETIEILKKALAELNEYTFTYFDDHASLIDTMNNQPPGFVLNLCDEGYQNDAFKELHVPAYLEMVGIPYSGAAPACLGLCYDKSLVRAYAMAYDVPVPMETFVDTDDFAATIPASLPALVKPNTGDSSIGITRDSVVHTPSELVAYLEVLRNDWPGRAALIQEYLTGAEYSVGLVGNPGIGYTYLPILEVDYSNLDPSLPKILGYESKWVPESPYWNTISYHEADIADDMRRRLYDYSTLLFERLQCRDYARFDFRCDTQGTPKLLEVNPNPGWCWDGKLNMMAGFSGMSYAELLAAILKSAFDRVTLGQFAEQTAS